MININNIMSDFYNDTNNSNDTDTDNSNDTYNSNNTENSNNTDILNNINNDDITELSNIMNLNDLYDDVREPDKPITETLIPSTLNYTSSYNQDYNEDIQLKYAIEESLKNADDAYFALQLEQIKNEENLSNQNLTNNKIITNEENFLDQNLTNNETIINLENLKKERKESFANILNCFSKLKRIEKPYNENLILLEDIINKYNNCEIDNSYITLEVHTKIFEQLRNIRIKKNEEKIINQILIITDK